ncbi:ATP-binding response regulator [Chthonobacter rhizosphaerae]|uniref:ATP-binding response regulator n=1 Tax=Chthonobacter rhizosphaerae TaxID=2735553 RepID=UPI0015EF8899|nr:hybrid sensor histidine kinase/response regulator [Chthonobacter rhizosphaerae]
MAAMDDSTRTDHRRNPLPAAGSPPAATGPACLDDLAHEMRGPLGAMLALSDLLLARDLDPATRPVVDLIQLAGRHLMALVDGIGEAAGRDPAVGVSAGAVLPAELARSVAALYAPFFAAAGVAIEVEVAPDLPASVAADETRVRQILANLLSNGLKFAARRVVMAVRPEGGDVVFQIADDGPGLRAGAPGRADPVTGRPGSGRGLPIARRLAADLGGSLHLEDGPEGGALAAFRLPVAPAAARPGPAASSESRSERRLGGRRRLRRRFALKGRRAITDLAGTSVLVVDDSLVTRLLMMTILESFDMKAVAVGSGQEAEAEVRRRRPDLVCLDWTLPGETGEDVRRRLAAVLDDDAPPMIAVTALPSPARLREAGWSGGPVVPKPFSPRDLYVAMHHALIGASSAATAG